MEIRSQDVEHLETEAEDLHIYEGSMEANMEHAMQELNATERLALETWLNNTAEHIDTFSHCDSVNALMGFVDHWHISHENREIFATWEGKMDDTRAAWEQLADGTDRNMRNARYVDTSNGN